MKKYKLIGFIKLLNIIPDFIYPVFKHGRTYYFQHSTDGSIQDFFPVRKDIYERILHVESLKNIILHKQSDQIYAYQVDEKNIIYGNAAYMESNLRDLALFSQAYHSDEILKEEIDYFLDETGKEIKRHCEMNAPMIAIGDKTRICSKRKVTETIKEYGSHIKSSCSQPAFKISMSFLLTACLIFVISRSYRSLYNVFDPYYPTISMPTPSPLVVNPTNMPTSTNMPTPTLSSQTEYISPIIRGSGEQYMLELTDQQFNAVKEAKFMVFQKNEIGYTLVSDTTDVYPMENEKGLCAEYNDQVLYILTNDGTTASSFPLPYTIDKDGRYIVEVKLLTSGEADNEPRIVKSVLICKKDEKSNILETISMQKLNETPENDDSYSNMSISDYTAIIICTEIREPKYNTNGALLSWDEWTVVRTVYDSCPLDKFRTLALKDNHPDRSDLYVSFEIEDDQGDRYMSDLLHLGDDPEKADIVIQYDNKFVYLERPQYSVRKNMDKLNAIFSVDIKNVTNQEILVKIKQIKVDQYDVSFEIPIWGMGPNNGLKNEETQRMTMKLPDGVFPDFNAISQIDFVVTIQYPGNDKVMEIPVKIIINYT